MSHMVIYRGTDGKPGYHQTDDIHDAVTFVEQLRNDNGVEHARIFRLEEVNFEYRPYFRVELKAGDGALGAGPSTPAVASTPVVASAVPAAVEPSSSASSTPSAPPPTTAPVVGTAAAVKENTAAAVAETAAVEVPSTEIKVETVEADTSSAAEKATDTDNGVGARRGLFGR
ncbi:MAG: hypothetical protein ACI8TP_002680 [Acidimicrobiales bacterium]